MSSAGAATGSGGESPMSAVWAWFFVGVVSLTNVSNCLDTYIISGVAQDVQRDLKFGAGPAYGLLVGPMFTLAKTLSAAPIGKLLEVSNRVHLLLICTIIWSTATSMMGFVSNYDQLLILRVVQGVAESGCVPIGQSLLFDVTPAGKLGTAMAIYNTGIYVGFGLAIGTGSQFGRVFGWRSTFVAAGMFCIPIVILAFLTLSEPQRGAREKSHAPVRRIHNTSTSEFLRHWIETPGLLLLCTACALRNAGGNIWGYNMVMYYQSQGVSISMISSWLSWLPMVAGVVGSLLGGYLGDKSQKWDPDGGRLLLLVGCCLVSAPLMALALILPAPLSFLSLILGYSVAEMWLGVAMTIMVGMVPDHMRTASVALYLFIIDNLGSIGLLLVQPMTVLMGNLWGFLLMVPGFYAISGLLFFSLQPVIKHNVRKTLQKQSSMKALPVQIDESIPVKSTKPKKGYSSIDSKQEEESRIPTLKRIRKGGSMVDLLDMVHADICWHHGHQCMICGCTRPKRF